jgi:hypothetical protein
MKKLFLIILLLCFGKLSFSQCTPKCPNQSATATVDNNPLWTYAWTVSGVAFTGQGTNSISIADVGASSQIDITVVISSPFCDSTLTACIIVTDVSVTFVAPSVCVSGGSVPVSGGSPSGGVYLDALGNVITDITSGMVGDVVTYQITSGGCTGQADDTIIGEPLPNTTIVVG